MTSVSASIMFIEHERKACSAIIDLLNQIGVLTVTDPYEAVNRARASVFDLYLLDDSLLEKSGPDLCGKIRSVDLDAPILFLSPELPEPRRAATIELKRTISRLILESKDTRMKRAESRCVFGRAYSDRR